MDKKGRGKRKTTTKQVHDDSSGGSSSRILEVRGGEMSEEDLFVLFALWRRLVLTASKGQNNRRQLQECMPACYRKEFKNKRNAVHCL